MKPYRWQIKFGIGLIVLSTVVYGLHFVFFRDLHHILIYLLGDIAFVPIEVLLVTLVIHQMLTIREKQAMLHKLNMVIGVFFSEVGAPLLERCRNIEGGDDKDRIDLRVSDEWSDKTFDDARARYASHPIKIVCQGDDLQMLNAFFSKHRNLLLQLLENPTLLEHESFTDVLWAVFHLADELNHRQRFSDLPESDLKHLNGDIRRAYRRLIGEWLMYMKHLKNEYPYLFSLAVRSNPFDPEAKPEVT